MDGNVDDMRTRLAAMRMLDGMLRGDDQVGSILPEAKVARLQEAVERFTSKNPFKVGDLVTVRADAPLKGAGEPHVVIASGDDNLSLAKSEEGNWTEGVIKNVMMISILHGTHIMPHLAPHWALEPYKA